MTPCSCGEPHPHAIMVRRSFDDRRVEIDSAGALWIGWHRSSTSGAAPVRSDAALRRARHVGRLVMENACILTAEEITDLYRRGRALTRLPATLRDLRVALDAPAVPRLVWTVLATDRDGQPTERVCILPRLRWPRMAVWDYCGGPGSAGGRYDICRRVTRGALGVSAPSDTYETTGLRFRRLADVGAYLASIRTETA